MSDWRKLVVRHGLWVLALAVGAGLFLAGWLHRPSLRRLPETTPGGEVSLYPTRAPRRPPRAPFDVSIAVVRGVALAARGEPTAEATYGVLSPFKDDNPALTLEVDIAGPGLAEAEQWEVWATLPREGTVRSIPGRSYVSTHTSLLDLSNSTANYVIRPPAGARRIDFWISWPRPQGILTTREDDLAVTMPQALVWANPPTETSSVTGLVSGLRLPALPVHLPHATLHPSARSSHSRTSIVAATRAVTVAVPAAPPEAPPPSPAAPPPPPPPGSAPKPSPVVPAPPLVGLPPTLPQATGAPVDVRYEFGPVKDYVIDDASSAPRPLAYEVGKFWVWQTISTVGALPAAAPSVSSAHSVEGATSAQSADFWAGILLGVAGAFALVVLQEWFSIWREILKDRLEH
jgi:hypothetical protein